MATSMDPDGLETGALAALVPSFANLRVLEIGCGNGRLTRRYAEAAASVLAIDPDESALARFRETIPDALRGHVELRAAPLEDLAVSEAAFDLVLFAWSL